MRWRIWSRRRQVLLLLPGLLGVRRRTSRIWGQRARSRICSGLVIRVGSPWTWTHRVRCGLAGCDQPSGPGSREFLAPAKKGYAYMNQRFLLQLQLQCWTVSVCSKVVAIYYATDMIRQALNVPVLGHGTNFYGCQVSQNVRRNSSLFL